MSQQNDPTASDTPAETLIEFPCHFPIKVMGETHADFTQEITRTIQSHWPDFDTHLIEMRASANGKYISLTCLVYVTSKLALDDIYRSLTAHPMVKVVL